MQNVETDDFARFWDAFPRKVGKKDAMRAWARLTDAQRIRALATIAAHVRYWQGAGRTMETIPHPATWLNGWRFDDELPEGKASGRFNAREYAAATRDEALAEGMGGGTAAPSGRHLRRSTLPH